MRIGHHLSLVLCALLISSLASGAKTENTLSDESQSLLQPLQNLERRGASVSALFVDLTTKKTIASLNPSHRVIPASLTKTLLGAASLDTWGAEKTFQTEFLTTAPQSGETLNGDLIFVGSGDPYLTNEKLWFLTTDVARSGIKTIRGDLILNTSKFADIKRDSNRLAGQRYSANAYDSPLSPVAVNFSVLAAVAFPTSPGKSAHIALEPYPLSSVQLKGNVVTQTNAAGRLQASRSSSASADIVTVSGRVGMDEAGLRAYRSVGDAERYTGDVLRAFLKAAGVQLLGKVKIDSNPPRPKARVIARVEGYPMDWQLRGLFKVSNNFIADMLTIQLDAERHKTNATLTNGAKILEDYVRSSLVQSKLSLMPSRDEMVIDSGSGLTPENRLSAQDFVAVFERVYREGRNFPNFLASLPIPGAEGTLKKRFQKKSMQNAQNYLRAKTGTLSQPVDAVSLGGYIQNPNGGWIAFAAIINGTKKVPSLGLDNIRSALDECVSELLPN